MVQYRINNPNSINKEEIKKELSEGKHVIVQFSHAIYSDKDLADLDELCSTNNENFEVRFYGNFSGSFSFDCNTLLKIPKVKYLSVNCLLRVENISALSELKNLRKLNFGVYYLKELEILAYDNLKTLTYLCVGETSSKAFNLNYLKEYQNLKSLIIVGHSKNIEAVGEIMNLEVLSLNSIKNKATPFVNNLKKLKILKFILGGRENIQEIEENRIENLEITWVRGFNDISNLSKFSGLKKLLIDRQKQLRSISIDKELPELKYLEIVDCKTLTSLTGLENLIDIEQLGIFGTQLKFDSIINQKLSPTLKTFDFYTRKVKADKAIKLKLKELGYKGYRD